LIFRAVGTCGLTWSGQGYMLRHATPARSSVRVNLAVSVSGCCCCCCCGLLASCLRRLMMYTRVVTGTAAAVVLAEALEMLRCCDWSVLNDYARCGVLALTLRFTSHCKLMTMPRIASIIERRGTSTRYSTTALYALGLAA